MRRAASAALVALALIAPAAASAAECPKTTLGEVEQEVMCPVCGTPLSLATEAPQANRERALIQRLVDRCQSKGQIKQELVAQFGDGVRGLPEAKGFSLSAYLVPAGLLVLAVGGLALALPRWRRGARGRGGAAADGRAGGEAAGRHPSEAESRRLEADLERYDL
jgi:cytochrome c-type biogenesis protein CcmH